VRPSVETFPASPLVVVDEDGAPLGELRRRIPRAPRAAGSLVERHTEQLHLFGGGALEPAGQVIGVGSTHEPGELSDGVGLRRGGRQASAGEPRPVLSRSNGWGKSEFAGMLVCAEALGPVRFAGWDHDGKPLGRPVPVHPGGGDGGAAGGEHLPGGRVHAPAGAVSATPPETDPATTCKSGKRSSIVRKFISLMNVACLVAARE
jgi:hypothetical protein